MKKIVVVIILMLQVLAAVAADKRPDTLAFRSSGDTLKMMKRALEKPHSPHKATVLALVLPGAGQIYNGQWWKVPILYGGIAGDLYGIIWNQKKFRDYKNAYVEWVNYLEAVEKNPDMPYPENPAWDKIPKNFDPKTDKYFQTSSGRDWFKEILKNRKDSFKRNRDLCYIIMAAIYAINVIDATVYAHFYDFEIDDDLSFHWQPSAVYNPISGGSIGLSLSLNF